MNFNDPVWIDALTYTAAEDRMIAGTLYPAAGVFGDSDFLVTQRALGANQSVDVSIGRAFIKESVTTDSMGWRGYVVNATGTLYNLPLAAAPVSDSRYDIVYAQVRDATVSGASNDWLIGHVDGVASASPALPTLPNQSFQLAKILRTAGAATVQTANITDTRVKINGLWNLYDAPMTATGVNPAKGTTGLNVGRWRYLAPKLVEIQVFWQFGTVVSGAARGTGVYHFTLPINANSTSFPYSIGTGRILDNSAGIAGHFPCHPYLISSTTVELIQYGSVIQDNVPFIFNENDVVSINLTYETV